MPHSTQNSIEIFNAIPVFFLFTDKLEENCEPGMIQLRFLPGTSRTPSPNTSSRSNHHFFL
jgi:hypothetical protein